MHRSHSTGRPGPRFRGPLNVPTWLGVAFTLACAPLAALIAYSVVASNPRVRSSTLAPASAFSSVLGASCSSSGGGAGSSSGGVGAGGAFQTTIRLQLVAWGASRLDWDTPAAGDFGAGTFKAVPDRADLPADINEALIVELYSK